MIMLMVHTGCDISHAYIMEYFLTSFFKTGKQKNYRCRCQSQQNVLNSNPKTYRHLHTKSILLIKLMLYYNLIKISCIDLLYQIIKANLDLDCPSYCHKLADIVWNWENKEIWSEKKKYRQMILMLKPIFLMLYVVTIFSFKLIEIAYKW